MSIGKVMKGAALLSGATLISRILGFIYFFPFQLLVGKEGVALYTYAYTAYGILLSFSTVGIPVAVSKFVAKYNSLGHYHISHAVYTSMKKLMFILGTLGFLVLFFGAPYFAGLILRSEKPTPEFLHNVTLTIKALSFALLIVPPMSITRGYYQGFQLMKPSAVSQVVEQIVRVLFILIGTFVVVKVFNGPLVLSISIATFAAVVGAVGSIAVLVYYQKKYALLLTGRKVQRNTTVPNKKELYKELMSYAIPIVFVGISVPLYVLIDQYTVPDTLRKSGLSEIDVNGIFAYIANYSQKLIMLTTSLATGFSLSVMPAITQSFTKGNKLEVQQNIQKIYEILFYFTIPMALFMYSLSFDIFRVLYISPDIAAEGSGYLAAYAPSAIFISIFTVSAAILQGINKQSKTMLATTIGILIKLILNVPLLMLFSGRGAVYATTIGYLASDIVLVYFIIRYTAVDSKKLLRTFIALFAYSSVAAFVVFGSATLLHYFVFGSTYIGSVVSLIVSGLLGVFVFGVLSTKSNITNHIIDPIMLAKLMNKFRLRKQKNVPEIKRAN